MIWHKQIFTRTHYGPIGVSPYTFDSKDRKQLVAIRRLERPLTPVNSEQESGDSNSIPDFYPAALLGALCRRFVSQNDSRASKRLASHMPGLFFWFDVFISSNRKHEYAGS